MTAESGEPLRKIPGLPPSEAAALSTQVGTPDGGTQEAKLLSLGLSEHEIARRAAASEHRRNENFRDHFERIAIIALWLTAVLLFVVGFTWLYHLLMPERWHWLSADQVLKLQNIVTGGVLAGVAGNHIKKRLG